MTAYLAIPWHLHPEVSHDRVHVAFRRLILGYLLSGDEQVLPAFDLGLGTELPRRENVKKRITRNA